MFWVSPEKQTPRSLWAACSTVLSPLKRFFLSFSGTSYIQFVSSAACPGAGHHWNKSLVPTLDNHPWSICMHWLSNLFSKLNRHRCLSLSSWEMLQSPHYLHSAPLDLFSSSLSSLNRETRIGHSTPGDISPRQRAQKQHQLHWSVLFLTLQDSVGLLSHKGSLLAQASLVPHQGPQVLLHRAAFQQVSS